MVLQSVSVSFSPSLSDVPLNHFCDLKHLLRRLDMTINSPVLSLSAGPARQTRQNFAGPATFSFVPDCMSDINLPVKHTSLYKVCQKFC